MEQNGRPPQGALLAINEEETSAGSYTIYPAQKWIHHVAKVRSQCFIKGWFWQTKPKKVRCVNFWGRSAELVLELHFAYKSCTALKSRFQNQSGLLPRQFANLTFFSLVCPELLLTQTQSNLSQSRKSARLSCGNSQLLRFAVPLDHQFWHNSVVALAARWPR